MADKYCDHGAYYGSDVNQPPATIAANMWGVPQEGDGRPQGWVSGGVPGVAGKPSRAAATVSIDFAGATIAAENTIIIAGATLTAKASGAGANQFNIGADIAATVLNIAAAINAATAQTNSNVVAGETWQSHQLRNAVFARRNPTSTSRLDIMCRAGSSLHNNNSSFRVVQSGIVGLANAGPYMFTGGESGCWGYFIGCWNTPMWPSGMKGDVAPGAYGVFSDVPPLAGYVAPGDVVKVRSNKTITSGGVNWITQIRIGARGTVDEPTTYQIDDGSVWPEDGNSPVFTFQVNIDNGRSADVLGYGAGYNGVANGGDSTWVRLVGKRYGNGNANFRMTCASGANMVISAATGLYFEGLDFAHLLESRDIEIASGGQSQSETQPCIFFNCQFNFNLSGNLINAIGGNWRSMNLQLIGCELKTKYSSPHPGLFNLSSSGNLFQMVELIGCKFTGFVAGSRLFGSYSSSMATTNYIFKNCDLGNVLHQMMVAATNSYGADSAALGTYTAMSNDFGTRDFFTDTLTGFSEWNGKRDYPTRAATLIDGAKWVLRICPTTYMSRLRGNSTYRAPSLAKINTLESGSRTVVVHMATHSEAGFNRKNLFASLQYEAVDGSLVMLSSREWAGGSLASDVATTWGSFDYNNGAQVYYSRELAVYDKTKIVFTTPAGKPIKNGAQVSLTMEVAKGVTNVTQGIFVCPELEIY